VTYGGGEPEGGGTKLPNPSDVYGVGRFLKAGSGTIVTHCRIHIGCGRLAFGAS
jgi:hypothetical protein